MSKDYYVYALVRPDTESIFYVGISRKKSRTQEHVQNALRAGKRLHSGHPSLETMTLKDALICKLINELGYKEIPTKIFRDNLDRQEACDLERTLIFAIGRYPHGPLLNLSPGGTVAVEKHSEATKTKMAAAKIGKPSGRVGDVRTPEGKEQHRKKSIGRRWITDGLTAKRIATTDPVPLGWVLGRLSPSLEAKAKMAAAKRGKTLSEEHKQKIGKAHEGQNRAHFDSSWWSSPEGKAHLAKVWINDGVTETKVSPDQPFPEGWRRGRLPGKAGGRNKGKPMTEAAKRHLSEINTGKTMSPEAKAKARAALIGRPVSAETRQKMSEKRKAWWAKDGSDA